jgi:integration host factor subunit beta
MNKGELISKVAALLRDSEARKPIHVPSEVFHISDDNGNCKDFVVKRTDKTVGYTMQDVNVILDAIIDVAMESIRHGESVAVAGFGTLGFKYMSPRAARHPRSGEWIEIDGHFAPKFIPSERLRASVKVYESSLEEKLRDDSEHPYDEDADPTTQEV